MPDMITWNARGKSADIYTTALAWPQHPLRPTNLLRSDQPKHGVGLKQTQMVNSFVNISSDSMAIAGSSTTDRAQCPRLLNDRREVDKKRESGESGRANVAACEKRRSDEK